MCRCRQPDYTEASPFSGIYLLAGFSVPDFPIQYSLKTLFLDFEYVMLWIAELNGARFPVGGKNTPASFPMSGGGRSSRDSASLIRPFTDNLYELVFGDFSCFENFYQFIFCDRVIF